MSWSQAERPEDVLGSRVKPYRLAGRSKSYKEFLNEDELADLELVMQILLIASNLEDSEMHVLLVGSAAADPDHVDVDLLVCTAPDKKRIDVASQCLSTLSRFPFRFEDHKSKCSVDTFASSLFVSSKIFALSYPHWNTFDISFVGVGSGSWDDVLNFHSRTNLAHSIIG